MCFFTILSNFLEVGYNDTCHYRYWVNKIWPPLIFTSTSYAKVSG